MLEARSSAGVGLVRTRYAGAHVLVTGGAGFVGAHVCRALLDAGLQVLAIDSLITGSRSNLADLLPSPQLTLVEDDVIDHLEAPEDLAAVLHLASPASPVDYLRHPIHTLKVGSIGTCTRSVRRRPRERGSCSHPPRRSTVTRRSTPRWRPTTATSLPPARVASTTRLNASSRR